MNHRIFERFNYNKDMIGILAFVLILYVGEISAIFLVPELRTDRLFVTAGLLTVLVAYLMRMFAPDLAAYILNVRFRFMEGRLSRLLSEPIMSTPDAKMLLNGDYEGEIWSFYYPGYCESIIDDPNYFVYDSDGRSKHYFVFDNEADRDLFLLSRE